MEEATKIPQPWWPCWPELALSWQILVTEQDWFLEVSQATSEMSLSLKTYGIAKKCRALLTTAKLELLYF